MSVLELSYREEMMVRALVASSFFLFCCWSSAAVAQIPIPAKYDGFAYRGGIARPVMVEAFLDPMCPDSRDSWPPLKKALSYYASRLSLIVHPFALPYHSNSYVACRSLHIANKLNSSLTYPLLELFFKYQEKYYNAPTYNKSRAHIVDQFSKLAVLAAGKDLQAAFVSGFDDTVTDMAARISFKYGCSRGVSGTPSFFVNGIPLPDYGSALDFKKWRSIIDPLFEK